MAIQPLNDRILIKLEDQEDKSSGGIILPDSAQEKPHMGKVVSVGKGKVLEDGTVRPLEVKTGDTILFGRYTGTEVVFDDKEYTILREDDVLAIVREHRK